MSVINARNNYIGQNGYVRMNCAQAVLNAFKEKFNVEDELVEAFKAFGGGRAPAGVCGAYYAVRYIIEKHDKEKEHELEQYFMDHAGALECSSIKGLRKLSCVGCVEKGAEFLENMR